MTHEAEYVSNIDILYADKAHHDTGHPVRVVIRIARPDRPGVIALNVHRGMTQEELNTFVRAVSVLDGAK
jgi:hypothetical protein